MSPVLAFDTSGPYCAAALLSGDTIVASRVEEMQKGQAERLMPLLEEVLAEAGKSWSDLDRIGVGIGPGNFTGIRISVSAARGLAYSLGIPAMGVSSLEAQAYGQNGVVVSSLDARQGRLYVDVIGSGEYIQPTLCDLESLPPIPARAEPSCVGYNAEQIAAQCAGNVALPMIPITEAIAHIASRRTPDGTRPAPLYLRPADAAPPRDPAPVIL